MTAESETIALRPTVIGDDRYADDYEVIWRGLPIGRITTQSGTPFGNPNGGPHWESILLVAATFGTIVRWVRSCAGALNGALAG